MNGKIEQFSNDNLLLSLANLKLVRTFVCKQLKLISILPLLQNKTFLLISNFFFILAYALLAMYWC